MTSNITQRHLFLSFGHCPITKREKSQKNKRKG
uniref:Uncharacterized protein n=1 Tax=Rhizophora mucronata TaxID=61149 RepID=A0A2P2Q2K0_RHIMU